MLSLSHCVTSTLSRCLWKRRRCYAPACGITTLSMRRIKQLYKPVHQKHPCTLWAMETRANFVFAYNLYTAMLCEYQSQIRQVAWGWQAQHDEQATRPEHIISARHWIPDGPLTPHPQCFSGHDDLKTDEAWPIEAYRAFYIVDKMKFA